MSDYLCPYRCSYRTNAGYCGYTGGHETCQYRRINGYDYESKQFYAEPVKTPEERYAWPPRTRGDKIMAMTDEELAELWWERVDCGECPVHRDCRMTGQDCKKLALDWLREEAKE